MFFERIVLTSVAVGSAILAAACSEKAKDATQAKDTSQAACEHINDVCADVEGFKTQNCSYANDDYAKLSTFEKAKADAVIPCVMAATSCQPAIECVTPPSSDSANDASDQATPTHDTEDACEHINDVCADEEGFKKQDCSTSKADYANLTPADKQRADDIVPCIMDAKTCKSAFKCLQLD